MNTIFIPWPSYHEDPILLASWSVQDHGKEMVKMKAVEGQRRARNQSSELFVSMAPINIQMVAMEHFCLFILCFTCLLKTDQIEETLVAHRKCVDYQMKTHLSIIKLYSTNFWLTCLTCMVQKNILLDFFQNLVPIEFLSFVTNWIF